ncbi:3720_t:CDS:2 [Funneliformis mosseae]|uniref:3720_t:CDS:1 n=1 Tax=Funneliformis mosseae TaxID=27381 RepID=A0A9N9DTX7_FUNMO|nr:3720_t:CDS:2 [Funneliformis mosseae]
MVTRISTSQVITPIMGSKLTLDHVMIYALQDMVVRIRPQKMETLKTIHVPWYLERFNQGKLICHPTPLLNLDCIINILEFLDDDPNTLFACTLVNRGWCKIAISILWSDPWKFKRSSQLPRNKKIQMISILLESLPQHYLNTLNEKKMGIPIVSRKTLFDYAKFVRYIRIRSLEWHLTKWVQYKVGRIISERNPDLRRRVSIIVQVLLEHIFKSTPTIYGLIVNNDNYTSESLTSAIRNVPEANISLASVKTFTFGKIFMTMPKLFETLSPVCHRINKLEICPSQDVKHTARLISNQTNLISLTLVDNYKRSIHRQTKNETFAWDNEIFRELLYKAEILTQLTLKNVCLSLKELNYFVNLEELNLLNYMGNISQENFQDLTEISLKKLIKFSFISLISKIYLKNLCKFIKNSKELTHLKIQGYNWHDPDYSITWINSLAKNNRNLISYEGPIGSGDVVALWILLDSCTNLQKLHLQCSRYNFYAPVPNSDLKSFDNILRELTRKQPLALRKLIVGRGWSLSSKGVERFISSRKKLSLPIRFEWNPNTEIIGDLSELIKRYRRSTKVHGYRTEHYF